MEPESTNRRPTAAGEQARAGVVFSPLAALRALRESSLPPTARWILMCFVGRADHDTGRGWSTYNVIARDAGVDRRTVGRMLEILECARWIVRFTKGRTRTTFQIVVPAAQSVRGKPRKVADSKPATKTGAHVATHIATLLLGGYAERRAMHYDLPPDGQKLTADELERVVLRVLALAPTEDKRAGVVTALLDAFFARAGRAWEGGDAYLRDHFHPLRCLVSDLDVLSNAIRPKIGRRKPKTAHLEAQNTDGIVVPERERRRELGRNPQPRTSAQHGTSSGGAPGPSTIEIFGVSMTPAELGRAVAEDRARQKATVDAFDREVSKGREAGVRRRAARALRGGRSQRS